MGILKKFLYFLIPLFLLGNVMRLEVQEDIFVNLLDMGMLLGAPLFIFYLALRQKKIRQHPLSKYVTVFLAALLFSLLVNIFVLSPKELLIASLYFVRLFIYTQMIFVFALLDANFCHRYLKLLFFAVVGTAILGLCQYFLYPNLRNLEYLGWDVHQYRVFTTFLDPNFAGVIFALGIAIGTSLFQKLKSREQKISIVGQVILIVSLLLTYSRTAFVAFTVAAVVFLARGLRKMYILIFFLLVGLGILLIPQELKSEGVDLTRTASIEARVQEFREGIDVFLEHPISGIGFNAYGSYNPRAESKYPENADSGIPNSYILTLATGGVIGMCALIYFFFGIYRVITTTKEKYLKTLLISSSILLATSALFENTLYYTFILLLYFSILGISIRVRGSTSP